MRLSAEGFNFLKSHEGLERRLRNGRIAAYDDGFGTPTIGYGTTIYPNGQRVALGDIRSRADVDSYLRQDISELEEQITDLVRRLPTQSQFDAFVSLAYNIGIGAFSRSQVLRRFNAGDDAGAAAAFGSFTRSGRTRNVPGLVRRRGEEAAMFLRDVPRGQMPQSVEEPSRGYAGPAVAGTAGLASTGFTLDSLRDISYIVGDAIPPLRPVFRFLGENPVWAVRALCGVLFVTALVWGYRRWQRNR